MHTQIEIVEGDVLSYKADVLALKFAQALFGVDRNVVAKFSESGIYLHDRLPVVGSSLLINSVQSIAARDVLFVGVEPLGQFDYGTIRRFGHSVLSAVAKGRPGAEHVAMTLHGRGFGLDEVEGFRSEVAGLLDAIAERECPPGLLKVSIVERDGDAVRRLNELLDVIVRSGTAVASKTVHSPTPLPSLGYARAQLGAVGHDSSTKPHVFVAMPFADEYNDRFHYGIQGAANAAGFLCERADLASFTGDVIAWVKNRIGTAALVVADLTSSNPNVYLEVGYAWGRGVNTVLLVAQGDELKFDVRTQRCLVFRSIRHLEQLLTAELKALSSSVGS